MLYGTSCPLTSYALCFFLLLLLLSVAVVVVGVRGGDLAHLPFQGSYADLPSNLSGDIPGRTSGYGSLALRRFLASCEWS